jgi:hypothetical protein
MYAERLVQWIDAKIGKTLYDQAVNMYKDIADRLLTGGGGDQSAATVAHHAKMSLIAFLSELKQGSKSKYCQVLYDNVGINADKRLHRIVKEAVEHASRHCFYDKSGASSTSFPVSKFELQSPRPWFDRLIELLFRRLEFYPNLMNQYNASSESKMNNLAIGMRLITECIRDSIVAAVKLDPLILEVPFGSCRDFQQQQGPGGGAAGTSGERKISAQQQQQLAQQAAETDKLIRMYKETKHEVELLKQQTLQQATTETLLSAQIAELQHALEDQKDSMLDYQDHQEREYERQQQALIRSEQQLRMARAVAKPALPRQRQPITEHQSQYVDDVEDHVDQDEDQDDEAQMIAIAAPKRPAARPSSQLLQPPAQARPRAQAQQALRVQQPSAVTTRAAAGAGIDGSAEDMSLQGMKQRLAARMTGAPQAAATASQARAVRPQQSQPAQASARRQGQSQPQPSRPPQQARPVQAQVQPQEMQRRQLSRTRDSISNVGSDQEDDEDDDMSSQASTSTSATLNSLASGAGAGGSRGQDSKIAAQGDDTRSQTGSIASSTSSGPASGGGAAKTATALIEQDLAFNDLESTNSGDSELGSVVSRNHPQTLVTAQLPQRPIKTLDPLSSLSSQPAAQGASILALDAAGGGAGAAGNQSVTAGAGAISSKNPLLPVPMPGAT